MSILLWRSILSGYPRTTRLMRMIWGRHLYPQISLWDYHLYRTGPIGSGSPLGSWIGRNVPNQSVRFQLTPPEPSPWTKGRKRGKRRRNIVVPRNRRNQSLKLPLRAKERTRLFGPMLGLPKTPVQAWTLSPMVTVVWAPIPPSSPVWVPTPSPGEVLLSN